MTAADVEAALQSAVHSSVQRQESYQKYQHPMAELRRAQSKATHMTQHSFELRVALGDSGLFVTRSGLPGSLL
eukprot:4094313-Amphidinium_carterae.1